MSCSVRMLTKERVCYLYCNCDTFNLPINTSQIFSVKTKDSCTFYAVHHSERKEPHRAIHIYQSNNTLSRQLAPR